MRKYEVIRISDIIKTVEKSKREIIVEAREEWKKRKTETPVPLSSSNQRLANIIGKLYESKEGLEIADKVGRHAEILRAKYPDYAKRTIFHTMGFSTFYPSDKVTIEEDFPGEDSVEAFVDGLVARYGNHSAS